MSENDIDKHNASATEEGSAKLTHEKISKLHAGYGQMLKFKLKEFLATPTKTSTSVNANGGEEQQQQEDASTANVETLSDEQKGNEEEKDVAHPPPKRQKHE